MNRRQFITTAALGTVATLTTRAAESKLRVAVIGHTGRGNYGHGLDVMWQQVDGTETVAVADADARGLAAAKAKLKVDKGFADYHAMLKEVKPDIVAVSPRHVDQHRDMILSAVDAGARGIYVEKPFCRTPTEADELVAACERRKVRLAVAHRNRYHPALPTITRLIKEDLIGRVLEMRARGKEDPRGGSLDLWVLGSHLVNLAGHFGGGALSCTAAVMQNGRPVTKADVKEGDEGVGPLAGNEVHARFEMEKGMPLFFDSIQKAGVASAGFGIQVIGTKGIVDLRVDKEPVAHLLPGSPFQPTLESRAWVPISSAGVGKPEPIENLGKLMSAHVIAGRDLVAAIREGREPICNAREGAATVEMICAVFESHRLGGKRVPLPLQTRVNPFTLM